MESIFIGQMLGYLVVLLVAPFFLSIALRPAKPHIRKIQVKGSYSIYEARISSSKVKLFNRSIFNKKKLYEANLTYSTKSDIDIAYQAIQKYESELD